MRHREYTRGRGGAVATILHPVAFMTPRSVESAGGRVEARGRGRPRVHTESWIKVSVVLFDRQLRELDRLTKHGLRQGQASLNRAVVIRGLIDGLLLSGLDVSGHRTEGQLRETIASRLRRR